MDTAASTGLLCSPAAYNADGEFGTLRQGKCCLKSDPPPQGREVGVHSTIPHGRGL